MRSKVLLGVLGFLWIASPLSGQSIQAFRSNATSQDSIVKVVRNLNDSLARRLAVWDLYGSGLETTALESPGRANLSSFAELRRLARDAMASANDPEAFLRNYRAINAYLIGFTQALSDKKRDLMMQSQQSLIQSVGALNNVPVLFKLPDVSFVVSTSATFAHQTVAEGALSTNLIGAGVGVAFDALGSSTMKEYFMDNIAIGVGVPYAGDGKLTSTLGLGLGRIPIPKLGLFPAINIQQTDTSDVRTPASVKPLDPSAAAWSSVSFSIAFALSTLESIKARMARGKPTLVLTVGVQLPYYYPGDPFAALVALFSSERSSYVHSGNAAFTVGVHLPLESVKPLTGSTQ